MSAWLVPSKDKSTEKYDKTCCIYRRGETVEINCKPKIGSDFELSQFEIQLKLFKTDINSRDIVILIL